MSRVKAAAASFGLPVNELPEINVERLTRIQISNQFGICAAVATENTVPVALMMNRLNTSSVSYS